MDRQAPVLRAGKGQRDGCLPRHLRYAGHRVGEDQLRLLGLREVTGEVDARLIAAIGAVFGDDFGAVRFWQVEPGGLTDRAMRLGPPAIAWTVGRHVLICAGREATYEGLNEITVAHHANTIAHELWHVCDYRRHGLVRWSVRWLRALLRYGWRGMARAPHELDARDAAERFLRSPGYAELVATVCRPDGDE